MGHFANNGASAIVLQQGSNWIVAFRGTDGWNDILQYPGLVFVSCINHFQPLLSAVASNAPNGTNFYFTGASLGGGATNLMADIAGSQYRRRIRIGTVLWPLHHPISAPPTAFLMSGLKMIQFTRQIERL